jgi:hypothetical protein
MGNFNPIIIAALLIQGFLSKASHLAGSLAGYLITTGILIWGLGAYSNGEAIALFGIILSKQAFIIACLVWYGYDTYELLAGGSAQAEESVTENQESEVNQEA